MTIAGSNASGGDGTHSMDLTDFDIIDAHMHQWDPHGTSSASWRA
ncbi:hypothetical protein ACFWU5_17380 [Nocardia sp. NPDC058640]